LRLMLRVTLRVFLAMPAIVGLGVNVVHIGPSAPAKGRHSLA
jgi:hypothetical protein